MAELLRRRRAIQASLASPSVPEGSIAGLSTDYLRTADAVERMQQNLDKDHSIVRRFTGGIVHQARQFCLLNYFPHIRKISSKIGVGVDESSMPSGTKLGFSPAYSPPSRFVCAQYSLQQ